MYVKFKLECHSKSNAVIHEYLKINSILIFLLLNLKNIQKSWLMPTTQKT